MSRISQQESDSLRLHRLVATVIGVDYGSLWWVPDTLWQRELPSFKPRPDGKHPGLCIGNANQASVFDPWPLLLGASKLGPLAVTGMSAKDPEKVGYFGKVLRPGMYEAGDFIACPGDDHNQSIRRNLTKLSINESEESELSEFLQSKGLVSKS